MTAFQSDRPRSKLPALLILLAVLFIGLLAAAYFLRPRFESDAPQVTITPNTDVMGVGAPIEVTVVDRGTGLKAVSATLSAGGKDHPIASEQYADAVAERKFAIELGKIPGLKEGPAILKVTARDASLWNSFKGNETVVAKEFAIDITPPSIDLIADDRYVNFGGVGVIVYKVSADTATSGVKIGDYFFQGFPGVIPGKPDHYFALFAHPYNLDAGTKASLVATDKAGNTRRMGLVYELKNVKYKKSNIPISENFLQNKVAQLLTDVSARQGTPKDVFIAVNKKLRKENEDKITEITRKLTPQILWKGAFTQLSNSKVEANFADQRTYIYNNEAIDQAYHVGYDLSVTRNYPVEAANSGTVAFTGELGIYGNTVIIDHGLGLFTLYSHLSSIDVKVGDTIGNRQVIGKTGETGLAAGDHLHYGVYLQGVAILPVEWWDPKWIADNITPKLEGRGGQEIAESQQVARRPGAGKRRR